MKYFLKLCLCVLWLVSVAQINAQDTLYVAAKNGLNLRSEPSIESSIVTKLDLNDIVIVDSVLRMDFISNRKGEWVYARKDSVSGYLFNAYLNKIKIESGENLFGSYFKYYLKKELDLNEPSVIQRPCNGGKSCKTLEVYTSNDCYIKTEYGYEWWDMEIVLKDWSINEILNILENAECYMNVCDYDIAIESLNSNAMDWETQTDDLFKTKIVEGENGNLQINISWTF